MDFAAFSIDYLLLERCKHSLSTRMSFGSETHKPHGTCTVPCTKYSAPLSLETCIRLKIYMLGNTTVMNTYKLKDGSCLHRAMSFLHENGICRSYGKWKFDIVQIECFEVVRALVANSRAVSDSTLFSPIYWYWHMGTAQTADPTKRIWDSYNEGLSQWFIQTDRLIHGGAFSIPVWGTISWTVGVAYAAPHTLSEALNINRRIQECHDDATTTIGHNVSC